MEIENLTQQRMMYKTTNSVAGRPVLAALLVGFSVGKGQECQRAEAIGGAIVDRIGPAAGCGMQNLFWNVDWRLDPDTNGRLIENQDKGVCGGKVGGKNYDIRHAYHTWIQRPVWALASADSPAVARVGAGGIHGGGGWPVDRGCEAGLPSRHASTA